MKIDFFPEQLKHPLKNNILFWETRLWPQKLITDPKPLYGHPGGNQKVKNLVKRRQRETLVKNPIKGQIALESEKMKFVK